MKRATFIFIFLLLISGCSKEKDNSKTIAMDNFLFGIIETTMVRERSKITYYDSDLNILNAQDYKYAELSSSFEMPGYSNDGIYLIPRGLAQKADEKKVVSLQIDSQSFTEFDVDRISIQYTTASLDFIYSTSNLNGISYITQTNKKTNEVREIEFESKYISSLNVYKDKAIAFINDLEHKPNPKVEVVVFNTELEPDTVIDLSSYGINQYKSLVEEDFLYVSNPTTIEDEVNDSFLIINLLNGKVQEIKLMENSPNDVFSYYDDLIITHTDLIEPNGSKVTKISKDSLDFTTFDLTETIYLSAVKDNSLFIVTTNNLIIQYDIDQNFRKVKEITFESDPELYISNIFVRSAQ